MGNSTTRLLLLALGTIATSYGCAHSGTIKPTCEGHYSRYETYCSYYDGGICVEETTREVQTCHTFSCPPTHQFVGSEFMGRCVPLDCGEGYGRDKLGRCVPADSRRAVRPEPKQAPASTTETADQETESDTSWADMVQYLSTLPPDEFRALCGEAGGRLGENTDVEGFDSASLLLDCGTAGVRLVSAFRGRNSVGAGVSMRTRDELWRDAVTEWGRPTKLVDGGARWKRSQGGAAAIFQTDDEWTLLYVPASARKGR